MPPVIAGPEFVDLDPASEEPPFEQSRNRYKLGWNRNRRQHAAMIKDILLLCENLERGPMLILAPVFFVCLLLLWIESEEK